MHIFRSPGAAVGAAVLAVFLLAPLGAQSEDRLEFGLDLMNDGSCSDSTKALALTYLHESEMFDKVYGFVRQAPSGGNCLKESTTADMEVVKRFPLNEGSRIEWQGVAKFIANVRSVSDRYRETEDGRIYALPVGTEENWNGILGAGAEIGMWDLVFGLGVVPNDWADGSSSQIVHVAISTEFGMLGGALEVAADIDTDGSRSFGSNRIEWRQDLENTVVGLTVGLYHDWGLTEILPPSEEAYSHYDSGGAFRDFTRVGTGIDTAWRGAVRLAFRV